MRQLDWDWVSLNKIKQNWVCVMAEIVIFREHKLNRMKEDKGIISLLGS